MASGRAARLNCGMIFSTGWRGIFGGLVLASAGVGPAAAQDYDLVIRGGRIVDGTGRAAYAGDVALKDGKITAVGVVAGKGREEIAAGGRVVGTVAAAPPSRRASRGRNWIPSPKLV